MNRTMTRVVPLIAAIVLAAGAAHALPGLDKLKDKAKAAAQAAKSAPAPKAAETPASASDSTNSGEQPGAAAEPGAAGAGSEPPGKGVWLNYDFVPGDRTIWVEDFMEDNVGDFPHRMQLKDGNFEVVEIKGRHYLRTVEGGYVTFELPEALPQRFTVEVEYHSPQDNNPLKFVTNTAQPAVQGACEFGCFMHTAYVYCAGKNSGARTTLPDDHGFIHARFTIDASYVKAYINEKRLANVPGAVVARTNKIQLQLPSGSEEDPTLITGLRIAEGGKKLYDVLAAKRRVATQGILFDTGSDVIRPESTPTLKEIGTMLQAHADLKLMIEGHTDNIGKDDANLALSERRAAAVKGYLVANYAVDAARLQSKGFGASRPVAPNTTAEGRQNNRRVELVRI